MSVTGHTIQTDHRPRAHPGEAALSPRNWTTAYLRRAALVDCACALTGGVLAAQIRFSGDHHLPAAYLGFTCALPLLWWASVLLAGGYDSRFIGLGSDEFRRVLNAAVTLIAGVAIVSYFAKLNVARGYMTVALPSAAGLDLLARHWLRKRLHRMRALGSCTRRVVAVGHPGAVADLVTTLRRDKYHGLAGPGGRGTGSWPPGQRRGGRRRLRRGYGRRAGLPGDGWQAPS